MKLNITIAKLATRARLGTAWSKHARPGEAPADLKDLFARHYAEHGVEAPRKAAAVAALLTAEFTPEAGETILPETEASLVEEVRNWATDWVGSGPLLTRFQRTTPAAEPATGSGRKRKQPRRAVSSAVPPSSDILLIELVVAPVRPEMRGGHETRRVVSVNKSLRELAVATLGLEGEARHAEALHASCVAHLAREVPDLRVTLGQRPDAPEPELIRLRREDLEGREAEAVVRQADVLSFAEHATEFMGYIERRLVFLLEDGTLDCELGFKVPDPTREHFRRHRPTYELMMQNPSLTNGARLMLKMTLGELGSDPGEAANDGAQPGTAEEAS